MHLKLIHNSSSLNKGSHNCESVWISDSTDFYDFISQFSLIEKINQTNKTLFDLGMINPPLSCLWSTLLPEKEEGEGVQAPFPDSGW